MRRCWLFKNELLVTSEVCKPKSADMPADMCVDRTVMSSKVPIDSEVQGLETLSMATK